ncbi:MAG: branched-chain amino acid ABC transporter permease, partial [Bradyrhizobium sp.]|nr:branched-chain amino acid ABC transporter permease [Bradyrhizobium sp.]
FRLLIGLGFLAIVFWSSDGVIGLYERWRRRGQHRDTRPGGHGHG